MGKKQKSKLRQMRDEMKAPLLNIEHDITRKQYKRDVDKFATFCRSQLGFMTIDECKKDIVENINKYSEFLISKNYTASTIHTYLAAVCKSFDVPLADIKKPVRYTSEFIRGRSSLKKSGYREDTDEDCKKWKRLIDFQLAVGARRAELKRIKGRDLVTDESGYLCVLIERGKGGKRQYQRISSGFEELVKPYFAGKAPDEKIFGDDELNNKINLHAMRAQKAQKSYFRYLERIKTEPGYSEKLKDEIKARWRAFNIDPKTGRPKPFSSNEIEGYYHLRGKTRKFAQSIGMPTLYNKLALMAVSIFELSHWRNDVTVHSYILAK